MTKKTKRAFAMLCAIAMMHIHPLTHKATRKRKTNGT